MARLASPKEVKRKLGRVEFTDPGLLSRNLYLVVTVIQKPCCLLYMQLYSFTGNQDISPAARMPSS